MKTIVTITIENPDEELLKALLYGSATKQTATIRTQIKVEKSKKQSNSLRGKVAFTCSAKKCIDCGKEFDPSSNAQKRCDPCGEIHKQEKKLQERKKKPETIGKTMHEINRIQKERESTPVAFDAAGHSL